MRFLILLALAVVGGGCAAHRQVGRPPNPAEITELNDIAAGEPFGIQLEYVRPISDGSPSSIRRIDAASDRQLTVVTYSGEVRSVDLSAVAGVTARRAKVGQGAAAGGLVGLLFGGLIAGFMELAAGPPPDAPVDYTSPRPPSTAAVVGTLVGFTVVGAIVGGLIGRQPTVDTFDFGGGHWSDR